MTRRGWLLLSFLTVLCMVLAPSLGSRWLSPAIVFESAPDELARAIYLKLRLPRVLMAFMVGGALAVSGVAFQSLFRNPLASPFTLGISSGAALGASLSFFWVLPPFMLGIRTAAFCALAGALLTAGLMWGLSVRARTGSTTILLSGVVLSFVYSSLIMLLQHLGDFAEVFRLTRWMLGTFEVVGFQEFWVAAPLVAVGLLGLQIDSRVFNLLTFGEEFAHSRGVSIQVVQLRIVFAVSCIVAGVVSVCGPIGFVGIIVPFVVRRWLGYDHRSVLPVSFVVGGNFLLICDTFARALFGATELPVGVCTAIIGGPLFVWSVLRRPQSAEAV